MYEEHAGEVGRDDASDSLRAVHRGLRARE